MLSSCEVSGVRGRHGGDLADACAEPDEGGGTSPLGQPRAPPSEGEEGELVDAATPGKPEPGGPVPRGGPPLGAAERARSGVEEWEVL